MQYKAVEITSMQKDREDKFESGLPGGGAGRKDEVKGSGVYPMSGPHPAGDTPVIPEPAWGQGKVGASGYEESGTSELWFSRSKPEQCRDIMTKTPICCSRSDTVDIGTRAMRDLYFGSVPIVESLLGNELCGIITDRDLVTRVIAEDHDPKVTRAEQVMTANVVTCLPENTFDKCLERMEALQVRRIPVVDKTGSVVGIVAQADIAIRMHQRERTAELVRAISKAKVMGGAGR
jgi:CBS domain-containing protein